MNERVASRGQPAWPPRQGRRTAVVTCVLSQVGQEPAVLADSSVLLPGRPWSDVTALTDEAHRDVPNPARGVIHS